LELFESGDDCGTLIKRRKMLHLVEFNCQAIEVLLYFGEVDADASCM
jgi:hypothetical protein